MKITLLAVGNLKDKFFVDAQAEYLKRLSKYAQVTVKELPEVIPNGSDPTESVKKEGQKILQSIKGKCYLLAIKGEEVSSESFADYIKKDIDDGKELTFIIGGSYGTSEEVWRSADKKISFGKITLPHRLMRVVFLEQLYRAFTIINGANYHK